ncbi:DUF1120 domain-containing protein [Serratia fonticola]|nr:DUF1120 domain-containing protein [Serratia fonticola]
MNVVKITACALAVVAATATAVMAESIDVKVIGTISPAACKPSLTGGGAIDYGTIPTASLKKDELYALEKKSLDFTITCDAPAKIALNAINGRPNTAAGMTETGVFAGACPKSVPSLGDYCVGLGLDGKNKIGGYSAIVSDVLADGKTVGYIYKNTAAWAKSSVDYTWFYSTSEVKQSWSTPGSVEPIAFKVLSGKFSVQAYLNKTSELDLTKPIKLDGLTTIELVYL